MKNRISPISLFTFLLLINFPTINAQIVSFTDASSQLSPTMGMTMEDGIVDMNNDGLDDIVRVSSTAINIDYQLPSGGFNQVQFPMAFTYVPDWSLTAGDIDGNGYNDLLFGDLTGVSFIYANNTGTAYTEDARPEYIFAQRSTFADIDNDGHLDAFVCHDVDLSHPYRNDGTGNLVLDQSLIVTADLPGNYAAIWVDYDNDSDTDLYITKCKGGSSPGDIERTNLLYQNDGNGNFTEVGAAAGIADNAQSWATVFEDFDNDGDFDAFIVNHDDANRFYENNGDGTFTDIINSTGIAPSDLGAWENFAADFNNDGYVDIFSELSKELYLNNGNMTFTGIDLPINDGAVGDVNDDGFLDIVKDNALYLNDGNANNWIKIRPRGTTSNLNGIGARVEITGAWGTQIREIRSGESFSPMNSLFGHFGIGTATEIDELKIKWPSGAVTTISNPPINSTYDVLEPDNGFCGDFNVTNTVLGQAIPNGSFYSNNVLNSNGKVHKDGVVYFEARNAISLNPGFEVKLDAFFDARIDPCFQIGN